MFGRVDVIARFSFWVSTRHLRFGCGEPVNGLTNGLEALVLPRRLGRDWMTPVARFAFSWLGAWLRRCMGKIHKYLSINVQFLKKKCFSCGRVLIYCAPFYLFRCPVVTELTTQLPLWKCLWRMNCTVKSLRMCIIVYTPVGGQTKQNWVRKTKVQRNMFELVGKWRRQICAAKICLEYVNRNFWHIAKVICSLIRVLVVQRL